MGWVDSILTGVFVLIGVIMTFFILLQEGKGGGLAALGGTKAAGVEGVTNPIRRATGYLAGLFFILAIILGILHKPKESLGLGVEAPPAEVTPAPGAGNGPALNAPAIAPKTDAKPADAAKTDAKPTDAAKPADAKKDEKPADAAKTGEAPKTDAAKPADAPKTDAAKPAETPKPAEEPKKADEKK